VSLFNFDGVTELGYCRFGVSDLEEWRTFVCDILGMEVRDDKEDKDKLWVRLDDWHYRILIEQHDSDDLLAMGLRLSGRKAFSKLKQKLTDDGVPFEEADQALCMERAVIEMLTLTDPSGIPVEVFHGPSLDPHLPFHPARRRFGKFVTGSAGLGHLLIAHAGVEITAEFYERLGLVSESEFRIPLPSSPEPIAGRFMHCNHAEAREHTIAFGLPNPKRCNHLMLEVDNVEDLMTTYGLIKSSKYPIVLDLGRHANDDAFSFYFLTPSGFAFEISYDCCSPKGQSYLLHDDYFGHQPNPDLPAIMGEVDEIRKET
jgi:2,3-dihydroxyethylbenzene 1,2-dioxygenase